MKDEINTDDTMGVDLLMERDYKVIELVEDAFGATPSAPVRAKPAKPAKAAAPPPPPSAAAPSGDAARVEEGRQRRAELRTEEAGPRRSREAIDAGLALFQAGEFEQAVDMFQLSLELPGVGFMRMDGSPKEYACASEGEENAALYNMACCYCKMGKPEAALTCLEALLDNGWDDAAAIRGDPDLAPARGPRMEQLLTRGDGLLGKLFGGKKPAPGSNKPWIRW